MAKMTESVKKVLSGKPQSQQTYENAVYDTEKYVTDATESLWTDAEYAVYEGNYPHVIDNLTKIWKVIQ